jgi:hypothetical protein
MNIRKYQSSRALRKQLVVQFEKEFSSCQVAALPWQLLEKLIQDHPNLEKSTMSLIKEAVSKRSIKAYFELQKLNDPQLYDSWSVYYDTTSVLSFLKKYPFGKVAGLDPERKAIDRVWEAELLCRHTNKRLKWFRKNGDRLLLRRPVVHDSLRIARQLIARWLGPLDLNQIYDYTRHGPGGSIGCTGNATTAVYKYSAALYPVTTRAFPLAEAAVLADPLWRRYISVPEGLNLIGDYVPPSRSCFAAIESRLVEVNYNKVTFVPKTALTHRAIAVEPLMNVYLQLGVGSCLKRKLKQAGINLRSQTRNQYLARIGSSWEGPADLCPVTLDLSMASDTLSTELVRELLPEGWFILLNTLRSPYGLVEGEEHPWAKFSSMGNGFTFELESMIFYALTCAVAKQLGFPYKKSTPENADGSVLNDDHISIYGDDIIVPAGMALVLTEVLAFSGFKLNVDKSFLFGPFRESCGMDYFDGRNVRPLFLKRELKNAKDLIFVANSHGTDNHILDYHLGDVDIRTNMARYCIHRLPALVRNTLLGPPTEDKEGHIHCSLDAGQTSPFVKWNQKCRLTGMHVQTWSYASIKSTAREFGAQDGPIYLQLMDYNSCRVDFSEDVDWTKNSVHNRLITLLALEDAQLVSGNPLKGASVYRRKAMRLRVATQFSNEWRNVYPLAHKG